MKRFMLLLLCSLILSCMALIGCPSKSSSPSSPGGSNPAPTPTTGTPCLNPSGTPCTSTATPTITPTPTVTLTPTFTETPLTCAGVYSFGTNFAGVATHEVDSGSFASRYNLPVDGQVTRLHAYVVLTNGASAQMGLYSDSSSAPGTLITKSNSLPVSLGWNSFPVPGTALLPAGTYWIAAANNGAGSGPDFAALNTAGGASPTDGISSFSVLAGSYGGTSPQGINCSFYADYCVPVGSPTPHPTLTLTATPSFTATPTYTFSQTPACTPYSFGTNFAGVATHEVDTGSFASRFTLPVAGSVNELHADVVLTNSANMQMGLYSNSGSAPGTLIVSSGSQPAGLGWNNFPIPATAVLPAGTYWIAAANNGAGSGPDFAALDTSSGANPSDGISSFSVLASSFGGTSPQGINCSFYADYCVPVGSPTPLPTLTLTFTTTSTPTNTPTVTQTPVCATPTPIGVTAVLTPSSGFNYFHSYHFTFPAGHIVGLHLYTPASGAGVTVQMGVYNDNSGAPGTLLTHSNSIQLATGWNTVPIPGITVTSGTYWLAVASNYAMSFASNGGTGTNTAFTSFNTTLTNNPSGNLTGEQISIYADYCP